MNSSAISSILDEIHRGLLQPLQLGEHSSTIAQSGEGDIFTQTGSSDQVMVSVNTLEKDQIKASTI
jgi:hypothetical protein